jgi:hypothetical protein
MPDESDPNDTELAEFFINFFRAAGKVFPPKLAFETRTKIEGLSGCDYYEKKTGERCW